MCLPYGEKSLRMCLPISTRTRRTDTAGQRRPSMYSVARQKEIRAV